jgi:para-aminobenzoate synthetase/4-amino-4-deoxychorismate lyase
MTPKVILDDATPGRERLTRFMGLRGVISARAPGEVTSAFAAIEEARASGSHVAGYLSYELGYLLEPRLAPLLPPQRAVPLLWFGVFEGVEHHAGATPLEESVTGRAYAGPLVQDWDEAAYRTGFDAVYDLIAAGDIYQANLSLRSRFAFAGDPLALYLKLRARSNAAHGAYIFDGERHILSLSPELFFDLSADGHLTARPMKGTAARGRDAADDALARLTLAESTKDRAENLMIVDLLRNDLGRIARIGSVETADLFAVETYPTLHQMVSTVKARLAPNIGVEAMLRALFPCGSVTGAPKIRAMEIIRALETSPRGVYCGAIGYFAPDGSAQFNVAIRTLTISGARGELGIGGAVVRDSRADGEYAECLLKARYFEHRPIELIETLGYAPGAGFTRRDRHLARMAASACVLGIEFDAAKAQATLAEVVAHVCGPTRVRLTLDEGGQFVCTAAALAPAPSRSWTYAISPARVASTDPLQRHKTNWRELYEGEFARLTRETGCDEVVFLNERGEVAEGSRTNIFARLEGRLLTPPLDAGVLPGCLRAELLEAGECVEARLMPEDLARAQEVYLGNSLRGLMRAVPLTLSPRSQHA